MSQDNLTARDFELNRPFDIEHCTLFDANGKPVDEREPFRKAQAQTVYEFITDNPKWQNPLFRVLNCYEIASLMGDVLLYFHPDEWARIIPPGKTVEAVAGNHVPTIAGIQLELPFTE